MQRMLMICECMAQKTRDDILSGAQVVTEETAKHVQYPAGGGPIPEACVNDAGISEHLRNHAEALLEHYGQNLREGVTVEQYSTCMVEEGTRNYRVDPKLNLRLFEKATVQAGLTCNQRFR